MTVYSSKGTAFEISDRLKNDFRFVRAFATMRSEDKDRAVQAAVELVSLVFGSQEEEQRFLREIAEGDGFVAVDRVYAEIGAMLRQAGETNALKNS